MVRNSRGAALFFVLVLTAIMAALAGAFVALNRQQFALTADATARQLAYEACMSGLSYAQSRLEKNFNWGRAPFPTGVTQESFPPTGALMNVTIHGKAVTSPTDGRPAIDENWIEGEVHARSGVTYSFTVRLVNNIEPREAMAVSQVGPLPGHTARVWVEGRSGSIVRRLDTVLRRKAFTDASMAAATINVTTPNSVDGWTVSSKEPANLIRSNGDLNCPDPTTSKGMKFTTPGLAKAGNEVYLAGSSTPLSSETKARQDAVEAAAKGRFQSQAKKTIIKDLDNSMINFPATEIELQDGVYAFSEETKVTWKEATEPVDPDNDPLTDNNTTVTNHTRFLETYRSLNCPYGTYVDTGASVGAVNTGVVQNAPEADVWSSGSSFNQDPDGLVELGAGGLKVDITNGFFAVPPGTTAKVDGSIDFKGSNGSYGAGAQNFTLLMGYDLEKSGRTLNMTMPAPGTDSLGNQGGAIVSNQTISVGGSVFGLGGLSADSSITLSANAGMSSTPSLGIAVRAGSGITMNPPPPARQNNFLRCDGKVFNSAMNNYGNWPTLEGLSKMGYPDDQHPSTVAVLDALKAKACTDTDNQAMTPARAWEMIDNERDLGEQPPAWGQPPLNQAPFNSGSGSLDFEAYLKLRNYLLDGNEDWLGASTNEQLQNGLFNQISVYTGFAQTAGLSENGKGPLQSFMAVGKIPDMFFKGLIYAGNGGIKVTTNTTSDPNGITFICEGAMVSKGRIDVDKSDSLTTTYNRDFLDNIVKPFNVGGVRLETLYFNLQ